MNKQISIDLEIARLVQNVKTEVSPALDDRVREAAANLRQRQDRSVIHRFWYLALIPGAAAALLAAVLIGPAARPVPDSPISEIRTEFELVDKNIKVIFIQKPDFHLYEENIHE
jgi:hypothetical protein